MPPRALTRRASSSSTSRRGRRPSPSSSGPSDRTGARAGHAGTLDPFATGLLLVLLGSATRLAQYLVGLDKRYVTEIDLRSTTATGDVEGDSVDEHALRRSRSSSAVRGPRGEITLRVPPPRP